MQDKGIDTPGRETGQVGDERLTDVPGRGRRGGGLLLGKGAKLVGQVEDAEGFGDEVVRDERVAHVRFRHIIGGGPSLTDHPRHDACGRGRGVDVDPVGGRSAGGGLAERERRAARRGGNRRRRQDGGRLDAHAGSHAAHGRPGDGAAVQHRAHLRGDERRAAAEEGGVKGGGIGGVVDAELVETIGGGRTLGAEIAATQVSGGEIITQERTSRGQEPLGHVTGGIAAHVTRTRVEVDAHDRLDAGRALVAAIPDAHRAGFRILITRDRNAQHRAGGGVQVQRDDVVDLVDATTVGEGLVEVERTVTVDDDVRDVAGRERGVETAAATGTEPDGAAVDDQVAEAVMGVVKGQRRVTGEADGAETGELTDEGGGGSLVDVQRRTDAEVDVRPVGVGLAIAASDGADGLGIGGAELEVRGANRIGVRTAVHRDAVGAVDGDDDGARIDARGRDGHARNEAGGARQGDDVAADGRGRDDDGLSARGGDGRGGQRKLRGTVDAEDRRAGRDAGTGDHDPRHEASGTRDGDLGVTRDEVGTRQADALQDRPIRKEREARRVLIGEVDGGRIADGEGATTGAREFDAASLDLDGAAEVVGLADGLKHQSTVPCLGQGLVAID